MSIIDLLFGKRQKTASIARERLQIIIAQERFKEQGTPDYLPTLQREIMEVLAKYVQVSEEDIRINHEKQDGVDVLEVNIVLPENKG